MGERMLDAATRRDAPLSLSAMFPHGNGIEDEGDRDGRKEEREEGVI